MENVVLTMIAAGLTMAVGAIAFKFRAQYRASLLVMGEVAQFMNTFSGVITEIQKTLEDEKVTPEEIKAIAGKLLKFPEIFLEIEKLLLGKTKR